MLRKKITYTDYDGVERTEDFDFHISKAELAGLNMKYKGGLQAMLEYMVKCEDAHGLITFIEEIILMSYGIKMPGGKQFKKSTEIAEEFKQSEAYSVLFMELLGDAEATATFVKGIIPRDLNPDLNPAARLEVVNN